MEEISNAFTAWITDRNDKFFSTTAGGEKYYPKDSTCVGPMFGLRHFEDAHIKPELILPLTRMLDPPKVVVEFLDNQNSGPMKGVSFQMITSLRMCTWLRDFMMDEYIRILNKELHPSTQYLFLTSDQAKLMTRNSKMIELAKLATKYDVVCVPINHKEHFFNAELYVKEAKASGQWVVEIGDSGHASIDSNAVTCENKNMTEFLKQIYRVENEMIQYKNADHCFKQNNGYDCGIQTLRRQFFFQIKKRRIQSLKELHDTVPEATLFRLIIAATVYMHNKEINVCMGQPYTEQAENPSVNQTSGISDKPKNDTDDINKQPPPAPQYASDSIFNRGKTFKGNKGNNLNDSLQKEEETKLRQSERAMQKKKMELALKFRKVPKLKPSTSPKKTIHRTRTTTRTTKILSKKSQ